MMGGGSGGFNVDDEIVNSDLKTWNGVEFIEINKHV